jgi:hypothetical protein
VETSVGLWIMPEKTSWTGSVWGTNRGSLIAEMTRDGTHVEGKILLFEPGFGQTNVRLTAEWNDANKIAGKLDQFTANLAVAAFLPQTGVMEGIFDPEEGLIHGEWKTDAGTIGKFVLVKVEGQLQMPQSAQPLAPQPQPTQAQPPPPQQPQSGAAQPSQPPPALVTITKVLGSYRLDAQALRSLAELVKDGTNIPTAIVNGAVAGREFIHIGVASLLADHSVPDVIYDVRVVANEPIVHAGNNTVVVTLKRHEPNTLYVSGYDRVWVEGKAAQLEAFLQHHESKATHILRSYGSNLNGIIFLAMLAFLPSVPSLGDRLKVIGYVFILLTALKYSWRLAANTKVFLREPKFAWYQKNAGWLLVLLEVALSAWIAYLVQQYLRPAQDVKPQAPASSQTPSDVKPQLPVSSPPPPKN